MKIKTEQFKDMMNKAVMGASNNRLIPLTQLMCISAKDKKVTIITTDATNYLYVSDDIEDDSEFYVTVFVDQFSKLISQLTSEYVELNIKKNTLEVSANGTYTFELPLDEDGGLVQYPNPLDGYKHSKKAVKGTIVLEDIKTVLDSVQPSLSTNYDFPEIAEYYAGDCIMATDRVKVASFAKKLFDNNVLVSDRLMKLLGVIQDSDINYEILDTVAVFNSDKCIIYGNLDEVGDYPVDIVNGLIDMDFPSSCKINKQSFINMLDRISLFVGKYDNRAIHMKFEKHGISITNMAGKSEETIDYDSVKDWQAFDCAIDIELLLAQLKAYASDTLSIQFGNEATVKLIDDDMTYIVALNDE